MGKLNNDSLTFIPGYIGIIPLILTILTQRSRNDVAMIYPDGYGGFRKSGFGDDFPKPIPIMPVTENDVRSWSIVISAIVVDSIVITMH